MTMKELKQKAIDLLAEALKNYPVDPKLVPLATEILRLPNDDGE